MESLRLTREVLVEGPDLFGRKSWIKFLPTEKTGWYWNCNGSGDVVPINAKIASYDSRRIVLKYKNYRLEIYEHIGAIKWTGLDGVVIESSTFPPYHGRVADLWRCLKPFCSQACQEIHWMPAGQAIKAKDSRSDSWVSLEPAGRKQGLVALVFVEMMNASWTRIYRFPRTLDGFFNAFTPGWPPYLYRVSQLAGLFGWPHHVHINWPNGNGKTFVKNAVLHRVADILGGLSLAAHDGLPVGEFVSWKGGHKLDLEIIKQI